MAETYRGLTIRIGGDTTKLTDALKAADRAISGTQNTLKKLDQAMKLDPSSINAARLQVGALAENAASTATKLAGLKSAMEQIGQNMKFGEPIEKLAENTKDAFTQAEIARVKYAAVCEEIAKIDHQVTKLSQDEANAASAGFGDKLMMAFAGSKTSAEELGSVINKLPENIRPSIEETTEFQRSIREVVKQYKEAEDALARFNERRANAGENKREITTSENGITRTIKQMIELEEKYQSIVDKFSKLSGTVFNFANANNSVKELRTALESLPEGIRPTNEEINKLVEKAGDLKDQFGVARSELEKFTTVAEFKDLQAEVEKATASIREMARAMADMKTPSDLMRGMYEITEGVKVLDNAISKYKSLGDSMASAAKLNPEDTIAATAAMNAYGQAILANDEKIMHLELTLDGLSEKLTDALTVADFGKTAETQLMDANYAVKESENAIAELEGKLADTRIQMAQFGMTAKEAMEVFTNPKSTDEEIANAQEYLELAKNAGSYVNELKEMRKEHERLVEYQDLSRVRKEYEETSGELGKARVEAQELEVSVKKLSTIDATPKFDTSFGDRIKSLTEFLKNGGAIGGFADKIKDLDVGIKDAADKANALKAAIKIDPSNMDLVTKRAEALGNQSKLTAEKVSVIKQAMAQLKADGIDEAAVKTGTFAVKLAEAQREFDETADGVKALESKLSELASEYDKYHEKSKNGLMSEEDEKKAAELAQRIAEVNAQLVIMKVKADDASEALQLQTRTKMFVDFSNEAKTAGVEVKQLAEESKKAGEVNATPKIDQAAFMQAVNMIGNAAKQMGQHIVESANEIDSAFRDMQKTVNGTEIEFNNLRDAAIKYSQEHVTSADTMLEMQALGGQLGILVDDLQRFGEITSNLDIATNIDAETIALQLGQIGNVLDLDIDGMKGFSDALVRLGNNMPAQESAIMNVAQRFGAVATSASFSGEEILAWSAAIASTGQRSEAAATAIGNTVSGIEQAMAKGGDEVEQFAKIAGMSAEDFAKAWKSSPTEALKAFIQGLHTLTESDESAVAALENMGITGVRQQQTLLGLSQTIDNLDDALAMSTDAWNGVADEWGKADDAAVEAQKKSEGFSGALAILQNNVQNLGAVLGDALVEPMKWASQVLEVLTNALKAIPGPVLTLIEALGAGAIAFGTIGSVVGTFTNGITGLLQTMGTTNNITGFINAIMGIKPAMDGATAATSATATAMAGPLVLGITAVIAAIALISSAVQDYNEKQEMAREATEGLLSATDAAQTSYADYASGADNAKRSLVELRDAMYDATEAQATLAEKMEEAWSNIGTQEATVDSLVSTIEELTSKQSLSADEQGELYAAVQSFNAITGQSISIIDEQNGKLSDSISTIHKYVDAWKESKESAQHLQDYGDAAQELAEKEKLLEEVQARLAKSQDGVNSSMVSGTRPMDMMNSGVSTTAVQYMTLTDQAKELEKQIDALKTKMGESASNMSVVDKQVAAIESELARYGDTLSNYGDLTDAELRQVIAAFNDTADSSVSAIERIRNALAAIKSAREEAANDMASTVSSGPVTSGGKKYDEEFYKDQKKVFDKQIKEMQRYFDSVYKAQQKAYDAEYKALQKRLDKEYKAQQKAYEKEYNAYKKKLDKEYDVQKKAYDKQYKKLKDQLDATYNARKKAYGDQEDALKDRLDDEYDALKKALDAQYKARKKELDDEYSALKKALDNVYNARKKELDKEYKALQKQNDKILKQLKDAQSKEVKAFKEATKARIAAIKAEYEARKKLLEGEDGTAAIDARIKALEDETKAERAQAKAREQAEKVASLQSAVDQAKTRRKRQEAEKALNDYLEELAQERREDEREAEIDRLEEQKDVIKEVTDARKDALDEERDAVIAAYEEQREIELEALQEKQSLEYEALKERLDAQEEALKEHHNAILEALKAEQQAELDAMQEHHDAILEKLKNAQQAQLDALKDANDAQLQALKDRHQAQLDALKDAQDAQLQTLKDKQSEQLQTIKDKQSEQLQAFKDKQSEQLEALKDSQSEQLQALKDSQSDALEALKQSQQDQLDAQKEANSDFLDEIKDGLRDRNGLVSDANKQLEDEQKRSLEEQKRQREEAMVAMRYMTKDGFERTKEITGNIIRDITDDVINETDRAAHELGNKGELGGQLFAKGIGDMAYLAQNEAREAGNAVIYELDDVQRWTRSSGQDALYNFAEGISDAMWAVENNIISTVNMIASYMHFSVPDKGPLSDEDKWGGDMVQNLIDGMRSKEGALIAQVMRMSEAMEDAFDPTLTVDAAFDAIDTMRQAGGPLAYQSKGAQASPSIELNVSINLSGVTVRDESDIDLLAQRVSQSMAAATARELAGRLG